MSMIQKVIVLAISGVTAVKVAMPEDSNASSATAKTHLKKAVLGLLASSVNAEWCATGAWRGDAQMDVWCNANCPGNCPESHCTDACGPTTSPTESPTPSPTEPCTGPIEISMPDGNCNAWDQCTTIHGDVNLETRGLSGNVELSDCLPQVTTIDGNLDLKFNPDLTGLSFDTLEEVTGWMNFQRATVKDLSFPNLKTVGKDFLGRWMDYVRFINVPQLTSVEGRFDIDASPNLKAVDVSSLKHAGRITTGCLTWFPGCNYNLKFLDFPSLETVGPIEDEWSNRTNLFQIMDEDELSSISMPNLRHVEGDRMKLEHVPKLTQCQVAGCENDISEGGSGPCVCTPCVMEALNLTQCEENRQIYNRP